MSKPNMMLMMWLHSSPLTSMTTFTRLGFSNPPYFLSDQSHSNALLPLLQVEDLSNWITVLERLDEILLDMLSKLPSVDNFEIPADYSAEIVRSTCCILKFLSILLRSAKDKRYFLALQVHTQCMHQLAIELVRVSCYILAFTCIS